MRIPSLLPLRIGIALLPFGVLACGDRQIGLTAPAPVPPMTSLVVRVTAGDRREPVAGASVVLLPVVTAAAGSKANVIGAIADDAGVATIPATPAGRYRLVVRRIGYQSAERNVDLRGASRATSEVAVTVAPAMTCTLWRWSAAP